MSKTKLVQISILPGEYIDFSSSHLFRFSVEEKYRLVAPSWFTSKNTQDGDDDNDGYDDDDDIIREKILQTVKKEIGFSKDDFVSGSYQKSVSDLISTIDIFSHDDKCCEFIKGEIFSWAERTELSDLTVVVHVKIDVLLREETNGEEFTGDEFDGEFKPVIEIQDDEEEEVEMAAAAAVEVDQEVIEIEDDEVEEEVAVVEEEDYDDEVREIMEIEYGYMEVEEDDDHQFMVDNGGGGEGIEEQWWNGFVEEEDNWFGFSKREGVSRDMIEASMKTREYDRKRDGDCMICMDGLSSKQEVVAEMPCSHVFHKPCIVEWLELKNSCPLCRFEIHNKDDPH